MSTRRLLNRLASTVVLGAALLGCDRFSGRTADSHAPSKEGDAAEKVPIDPVALNGPIFQGWDDPVLSIVISGAQQGYLEPCGCAGLENQKGGLSRRLSMIDQLHRRGWETVALDTGDQIRRFGRQAEIKFHYTVDALKTIDYEAVGLGAGDLRMSADDLLVAIANLGDDDSRFVSANVALFDRDAGYPPRWRVVERAGLKLGITSVLSPTFASGIAMQDVVMVPPAEALAEVIPQLQEQQCDLLILLAQATLDEASELARQFPFDLVIATTGVAEPPREPYRVEVEGRETFVVELGHKGMYAAVVGVYEGGDRRFRFQRVPLDSRFPPARPMQELLAAYQTELQTLGFGELGLRPVAHPKALQANAALAGAFVGANSCKDCHARVYEKWESTPHGHATETLTRLDPPRQFDPECISCHTTGWSPQEYIPYETGYRSLTETPLLTSNGCENCHGPGASHVAAEQARGAQRDLTLIEELRAELRLTKSTAEIQVCRKCHDLDNSPDFDFDTYWPKIEHPWKD